MSGQDGKLLEVRDLKTWFRTEAGVVRAADGVDFDVRFGEILGIVGESGCGKSVTALSVMGLVPKPHGRIVGGSVLFGGRDLTQLSNREMRSIRGAEISMIFQEPMTSLNPVYTAGDQIAEAIILHKKVSRREALAQALDMLQKVGIPEPRQRLREYPHQLSGGMRQRVMIAMALSCGPKLLMADEPTTALDVTIQAQILKLLRDLRERIGMAVVLITHDLGVIAEMAERIVVMYAGKMVEYTDTAELFSASLHPYTWGLMHSIPRMDLDVERLPAIAGMVPNPLAFPPGCKYHPRCPLASERCRSEEPAMQEAAAGHFTRCWHVERMDELKRATPLGHGSSSRSAPGTDPERAS
jgi:peptide/nickel transport system ATP-binding protein/oligopeptide transport system ATP-binding protein